MKLRLILVMAVLCLFFLQVEAQTRGVYWENFPSWKSVLEKAKSENRPIFLDLYASWCGPCKWMDKEVYTNDSLGEFINREFISIKVQMDSLKWDDPKIKSWYPSLIDIKTAYDVKSFPTLLFLSPNGEIYQKIEGMRDAESLLREAKDALKSENQYASLMKVYSAGNRDPYLIRSLVRRSEWLGDPLMARKIAKEYISRLSDREMLLKDNIWLIYDFTNRSSDPGFKFLRDKQGEIERVDEKMAIKYTDSKVRTIIRFEAIEPFRKDRAGKANWQVIHENLKGYGEWGVKTLEWLKPDIIFNDEIVEFLEKSPNWDEVQKKVARYKFDRSGTLRLYENIMNYYKFLFLTKKEPDNKNVIISANFYFNQEDAQMIMGLGEHMANEYAWMAFVNFKDEEGLNAALRWSERAIREQPKEAAIYDTYANLLYKLGRRDEALKYQEIALSFNSDDKAIKVHFEKMKQNDKTWKE